MTDAQRGNQLTSVLAEPGPWTYAYVDGPGDEPRGSNAEEPQGAEKNRQRAIRDALVDAGAADADVEAMAEALLAGTGVPSPSARYLLVRDGRVVLDESFVGERLGPERVGHGPVPEVLPLVRQRGTGIQYLVIETDREGAEVRLERTGHHEPELAEEIDGEYDKVQKVRTGFLSQARIQRSAVEMWKHNQSDVAEAVDRLVREHRPAFVLLAGDLRARQLLVEKLEGGIQELVIEVDVHTRAGGADDTALSEALDAVVAERLAVAVTEVRDRAAADHGRSGAVGVPGVVSALQKAQVDALVLDSRMLAGSGGESLLALDSAPWVAEDADDTLAAATRARVSVAEALARAAILSGARVLIEEHDDGPPDAPRDDSEPGEPVAALRW